MRQRGHELVAIAVDIAVGAGVRAIRGGILELKLE